jgi:hypothetical protein
MDRAYNADDEEGPFMDSRAITAASVFLVVTALGCSTTTQIRAQQSQAPSIGAAYAECHRKFHPIKQAIALAACENRAVAAMRSMMPDPDLMDQELAYNLVLAERVQKGRMTLIEKEAAATQFHSQIMAEGERRLLARRAAAAQESAAASQPGPPIVIDPPRHSSRTHRNFTTTCHSKPGVSRCA